MKNIIKFEKEVSKNNKKEFDSKPVYNERYLKTKKNLTIGKSTLIFTRIRTPKEDSQCIYLSISNIVLLNL